MRFRRTNRGIIADAQLQTALRTECSRCLRPMEVPVDVAIEEEFLPALDLTTGQPVPAVIRAARSGEKPTAPDTDSAVTARAVPSCEARSVAWRLIASTSSSSSASVEQRASSQAVTREGIALVPLGATSTRPKVAR